jgi:FMN phosphatase YigB (HAD superfamily)
MKIGKNLAIAGILASGILVFTLLYMQKAPAYNITQIDSFAQATDALAATDKNSLVLFDVDDTLIEPASVLFRSKIANENDGPWIGELFSTVFANAKHSVDYYLSILQSQEVPLLIEKNIVQTITSLQDRGVKVLALTALWTGAYFTIPSVPEWRLNKLKELGIDFSKTNFPDMTFDELPQEEGHFPMLYHGILCTIQISKGQVLGAFLDRIQWKPDQVVFFDDNLERVESVAQEMQKRKIPFHGYHYKGADFVPGELNKEVAEFQLKYLVEHEEWLSEEEARALIVQQKQHAYAN